MVVQAVLSSAILRYFCKTTADHPNGTSTEEVKKNVTEFKKTAEALAPTRATSTIEPIQKHLEALLTTKHQTMQAELNATVFI